ncbi:MAG: hypothetical protein ACKOA9_02900 [Actinomycetota bacterium]
MIAALVAITVLGLVVSLIVLFARDAGPTPADIAIAYELAWDRLDFDTLWSLSGDEMRDGLDKRTFIAAKSAAYAGRTDLGGLAERVDIEVADVGIGYATVRTRITLFGGETVHNDIVLTKRNSAWTVTGYELTPGPAPSA